MGKRPILFVDHATGLGGAEHSLLLLINHLDATVWQPHLATVEGDLAAAARQIGVPVHLVPLPRLRRSPSALGDWWRGASRLAAVASDIEAGLLHSNTVRAALYTALAAKISRQPWVWHFRDFWLSEAQPKRRWLDRFAKQLLCKAATQIIVNSKAVSHKLPDTNKINVVYNGIDLEKFVPDSELGNLFRKRHGIAPETAVVGMVGRLRPWKGQKRFLRMASQLQRLKHDVHFLLVGGDPFQVQDGYVGELHELTRELGLETAVTFLGQQSDVRPALAAMDLFVHPGEPEPFGLVNIEALAMGKPVIAFAHGALPEIVQHEVTGLLIPPTDGQKMASSIAHLLTEPTRIAEMGAMGRQQATARFGIQKTVVSVANIYEKLNIWDQIPAL